MIGPYIFYGVGLLLALIIIFTIVNRAQYTKSIRDRRFWNKRRFPTESKAINTNLCLTLNSQTGVTLTDISGNSIGMPSMPSMPSMDISGNSIGMSSMSSMM